MKSKNVLLLAALGAIWGSSFLFIKIGVGEMGPMTLAMGRVFLATLGLSVIAQATGHRIPRDAATWRHFFVMGAVGIALPFGAIAWGTQFIPSGLSAILNASMPLFTVILAAVYGEESLRLQRVVGLIVGFAGIVVLTWPQLHQGLPTGLLTQSSLAGEIAIVVASLGYAVAVVYAQRHLVHHPPLIASLGQVGAGWLCLLPFALAEQPWTRSVTAKGLMAVAILGFLGTALAYILYHSLVRAAGSTSTSLVTYIVPLFAVVWGRLILGEPITVHAVLALGLILAGVLLVRGPQIAGLRSSRAAMRPSQDAQP